jgi:hypothetical protein
MAENFGARKMRRPILIRSYAANFSAHTNSKREKSFCSGFLTFFEYFASQRILNKCASTHQTVHFGSKYFQPGKSLKFSALLAKKTENANSK